MVSWTMRLPVQAAPLVRQGRRELDGPRRLPRRRRKTYGGCNSAAESAASDAACHGTRRALGEQTAITSRGTVKSWVNSARLPADVKKLTPSFILI